jgi:hypothetical protein
MIKRYVTMMAGVTSGGGGSYTTVQLATSNTENTICAQSPDLYFISGLFNNIAPGVVIYTNPTLTTPLVGFSFVKNNAGTIYYLDDSDGTVGVPTGNTC